MRASKTMERSTAPATTARPIARVRRGARAVARAREPRADGSKNSESFAGVDRGVFGDGEYADPAIRRKVFSLRERLSDAMRLENWRAAAAIRDEIEGLRMRDPRARAEDALEACVMDEDYECASNAKATIEELERDAVVERLAPCESERTSRGVRVRARSRCVTERSAPKESKWFFQYLVTITNVTNAKSVKLLSRSWLITDEEGKCEAVRGAGVVGKQPLIRPGETFEYASSTPLNTRRGTMEGFYRFVEVERRDEARAENAPIDLSREDDVDAFNVEIGVFGLSESVTM